MIMNTEDTGLSVCNTETLTVIFDPPGKISKGIDEFTMDGVELYIVTLFIEGGSAYSSTLIS